MNQLLKTGFDICINFLLEWSTIMFTALFKHYIFFVFCLYVISRLIDIKFNKITFLIVPIVLDLETVYLKQQAPELSFIFPFLTLFIMLCLFNNLPLKSCFSITLISFGINIIAHAISAFAVALITLPFRDIIPFVPNLFTVTASLIYPIILVCTLKAKRISGNLNLLIKPPTIYLALGISIVVLFIATSEQTTSFALSPYRFLRIGLIFFAAFVLILWWRTQITKSYRERLRALEVESLRVSKQEQAEYISQLERENERMGRIIHKDNRIVNAMADSIGEYLQYSAYLSGNKLAEKGSSLQAQISEIRYDRQVLLDEKPATPTALPQTGYAGIDAMVTYMTKEASENKINFQFHYGEDFFTESGEDIKETDIVHLLSDSLENAIIATKFAGGKFIELSMLKIKGFPLISISDSGIPFELDTYMNLGLQKASTHLDTGGSGIGLMDLWELKEKYKATLYIDEHPEDANMTKRIVYIFDKKNRYMISTDRFKELQQKQTRADMFVINPNTEAVI